MKLTNLVLLSLLIFVFSRCQQTRDNVGKEFQKTARGQADEMVLIADTAIWKRPLGDALKNLYSGYILGLPQDEPKFNVHNVNPRDLNSTLKTAVNMVFVMTLDNSSRQGKEMRRFFTNNSMKQIQQDSSIFMTVRKDEFAKGQVVLYLYAQDEEQLLKKIEMNKNLLSEVFESAVRERTRAQLLTKLDRNGMNLLTEDHGYFIKIPYGWDIAKNLKDFVWIRKLEAQSEWDIIIYERPYSDENVFNDVESLRDEITETYLRDSQKPELFITRQAKYPAFTERVNFNKRFAVEARGLWKNSDLSGGGPYVSYTLVDEETQTLYYIEGYVYSPGTKKKKLIREVEAVLTTFRTPSDLAAK